MSEFGQKIGTVIDTRIYPVVGMGGISCPEGIQARKHSIVQDRRVMYTKDGINKDGDTVQVGIHTMDAPELLLYQPRLENPKDPKNSRIIVLTPEGREYRATEEALLAELSARLEYKVSLAPDTGKTYNYSGLFSAISKQSIMALSERLKIVSMDPSRLRMNVQFDWDHDPLPGDVNKEQALVGKQIKIGEDGATIYGWESATRCRAVNSRVEDGELTYNSDVFKNIPLNNGTPRLGLYSGIDNGGLILPGDDLWLRGYPSATEYN